MKKLSLQLLLIGFILTVLSSCKSEFETIRTSGNPEKIISKAFEYYEKKEYQHAQTMFDLVLTSLRGDPRAEKAYYYYAYTHYYMKQYVLASYYFKNFSNTFPNSPFREEAAFMAAYSNYELSPNYRLDQASTLSAIEEFQSFTNNFPKSNRIDECNKLIDQLRRKQEEKAFYESELYYNVRQYQAAVISFDNVLRDYPESPDIERIRYLIAKSAYKLAENSVVDKKPDRFKDAISRCNDFLERHAASKYNKEIKELRHDSEIAIKAARKKIKLQ
jgi:outer membrane protein assembly factor BamD